MKNWKIYLIFIMVFGIHYLSSNNYTYIRSTSAHFLINKILFFHPFSHLYLHNVNTDKKKNVFLSFLCGNINCIDTAKIHYVYENFFWLYWQMYNYNKIPTKLSSVIVHTMWYGIVANSWWVQNYRLHEFFFQAKSITKLIFVVGQMTSLFGGIISNRYGGVVTFGVAMLLCAGINLLFEFILRISLVLFMVAKLFHGAIQVRINLALHIFSHWCLYKIYFPIRA